MNSEILIVPQWVVDAVRLAQRNWIAFVGTILLVIATALIVELAKKHWNFTKEEATAKKLVNRLILALGTVFGVAGSLAYFVSQNMPVFHNIPYIAEYVPTLLGGLWAVYNFRLSKTFTKYEAPIAKWAGAAPAAPTTGQTATETPMPTAAPESFL